MRITFRLLRARQRLSGGRRAVCRRSGDDLGGRFGIRHTKHLRNLYVSFWRWATWKIFRGRRPETDRRAQAGPERRGVVHHRCGFPERTRFPEDACRTASRGGRVPAHHLHPDSHASRQPHDETSTRPWKPPLHQPAAANRGPALQTADIENVVKADLNNGIDPEATLDQMTSIPLHVSAPCLWRPALSSHAT